MLRNFAQLTERVENDSEIKVIPQCVMPSVSVLMSTKIQTLVIYSFSKSVSTTPRKTAERHFPFFDKYN